MEPKRLLAAIPIFGAAIFVVFFLRPYLRSIEENVAALGMGCGFATALFANLLTNFVAVSDSEYAEIPGKKKKRGSARFWIFVYAIPAGFLFLYHDWASQFTAGFLIALAISITILSYFNKLSNRHERTL